jgi:hypothetical protein
MITGMNKQRAIKTILISFSVIDVITFDIDYGHCTPSSLETNIVKNPDPKDQALGCPWKGLLVKANIEP